MKKLLFSLVLLLSMTGFAQTTSYTISSYFDEGIKAPNTHYLGEAWLKRIIQADESLSYNITKAMFKANSTLDWHKHTSAQVLVVVEGKGYYQERGKEPFIMKEGDVIRCNSGVEHWHSSSKEKDVTYLAIYSGETQWTEVLSQEAYDAVAAIFQE